MSKSISILLALCATTTAGASLRGNSATDRAKATAPVHSNGQFEDKAARMQQTFPMVASINFTTTMGSSLSTCEYPGMLVPELSAPTTSTGRERDTFVFTQVVPSKVRTGMWTQQRNALSQSFETTFDSNGRSNSTAQYYADQEPLFNNRYPSGPEPTYYNISNVQGSNGAWKSDRYASEFVGHNLLVSFLTAKGNGVYEMDLTGTSAANDGPLTTRKLRDEMVDVAPEALLRCKAELISQQIGSKSRPALTKITVYSPEGVATMTATPADGLKWELAKIVMHGMAAFVLESFHTSVHLLASVTSSAAMRSIPQESVLSGIIDAQNTQVTTAIWEEMINLHNDAPSLFNGKVYDLDIKKLRALNAKVARYLLQADPREFLSMQDGEKPEWWAGGAGNFIEPIEKFALSVAQGAIIDAERTGKIGDAGDYLQVFQQQLKEVGAIVGDGSINTPSLDATSEKGLARLYTNMVFYESVFHAGIFSTRELFLPLFMPMTSQFLPYLAGAPGAADGVVTIENAINKFVTTDNLLRNNVEPMNTYEATMYATGSGYNGGVEIADGPYFNTELWSGGDGHIEAYQSEIDAARSKVMSIFGTNFATPGATGEGFLPGYYYPADAPKPSGYVFCATVYI